MNRYLEQLLEVEVIAKSEPAAMLKDDHKMCNGRLILSAKRLIFICHDTDNPEIDIDLDTVNALMHESHFVDHNILAVTYLLYQTARFTVIDYSEWEKAIETQRMLAHV